MGENAAALNVPMTEGESEARSTNLAGSYAFAYALGAILIALMIWLGGPWQIMASSRLLSLLIDAGVVQYHDTQPGIWAGLPHPKLYMQAKEPLNWNLIRLAGVLLIGMWMIQAVRFHVLARFAGIRGNYTQHARAYLEGIGINRFVPYNRGYWSTATLMVQRQGADLGKIAQTFYLERACIVFQIVFFAAVALYLEGWTVWLSQIVWPIFMLVAAWLIVRPNSHHPEQSLAVGSPGLLLRAFQTLLQKPATLITVLLLSIVAFTIQDIVAYMVGMSLTTPHLILNFDYKMLLMGLVGGYIARLIQITPGGIGQFEFGMATSIMFAGKSFTDAAIFALVFMLVKYAYSTILLLWVYILRVDYSFEVLKRVERVPVASAE